MSDVIEGKRTSEKGVILSTKPAMRLELEHWRPVECLHPEDVPIAYDKGKVLVAREVKESDLVLDIGLDYLCNREADTPPPKMRWTDIGTNATAVSKNQTFATLSGVMRQPNTYTKDAPTGEASLDASFSIAVSGYSLNECALINVSGVGQSGITYCRDVYTTKNVLSGDTVNVYYTMAFSGG